MSKFKLFIKQVFMSSSQNLYTLTIISIVNFYIFMTFYANLVYQQFSSSQVLSVSLSFFLILTITVYIFDQKFFRQKFELNIKTIFFSFIIVFILIMLVNAPSEQFKNYFYTFPLLKTELGLGYNHDSVFHISLIQSILNYGYPSIGQDGVKATVYHVLSHYMDASILFINHIEAYDSYGMFFHFKSFLLVSSILIFLSQIIKKANYSIFVISFLITAPIIIASWHAIGSHALWFTSIIILLSFNKVNTILLKKEKNSIKDYIFLFIIIILISLGKISTGFMYSVFIGVFMLIKKPKSFSIYIIGILWIIFFLFYSSLFTSSTHHEFKLLETNILLEYLFYNPYYTVQETHSIFISILLIILLTFMFKQNNNIRVLITSIITFIVFLALLIIQPNLNTSDIFYFEYGFFSILILFVISIISYNFKRCHYTKDTKQMWTIIKVFINFFINILLTYINKQKNNIRILTTSLTAFIILLAIFILQPNFTPTETWYIKYSIFSILILFIINILNKITYNFKNYHYSENIKYIWNNVKVFNLRKSNCLTKAILFICFLIFSMKVYILPPFNLFHLSPRKEINYLLNGRYKNINKKLYTDKILNISDDLELNNLENPRPLKNFRNQLYILMKQNAMTKQNTLLYIPKEIFNTQLNGFLGSSWSKGLLIYAVAGVPLIYAIEKEKKTYGFGIYSKSSFYKEKKNFNVKKSCTKYGIKNIIMINDFNDLDFIVYTCQKKLQKNLVK